MEESYDPVTKIVYMPFFEAEITNALGWEIVRSHMYICVYRICQIT